MPDPIPAECSPTAAAVIAACEREWPHQLHDCSGFVRAVARDMGVLLTGQADNIVDFIDTHWRDPGSEGFASEWADAGFLVIAGLRGDEQQVPNAHGHVVIIVPGTSNTGHALGYWGRFHGTGMKQASISLAWRAADLENVIFRATPIGV
jgi:hypothetical protein